LPDVLGKTDPKRSYIASSPIGTPPAEKAPDAKRRGPNADGYGDQHNWDVWHGRGDWRFYSDSKGRFSSEYGFASSPTLECWKAAGVDESVDYQSPVARWHDKTAKGYDTFVGYTKLHYPDPASLEDWIYYSQLNQRDALRHGVEHYRRSEFCRGSLIWQVNDCWPVQSWAILDSLGNYKALAYELRRLYADVMFSLERHNEKVTLWVANDGSESWADSVSLQAFHTVTGELVKEWDVEAECDADARRAILDVDISGLNVSQTILYASAFDANEPVWRLLGEPKETRFPSAAKLTVSTAGDGHIRIHTPTPLVDLMLLDNGSVANIGDNFLTIPQPGVFDVRVHTAPTKLTARSLAGIHPVVLTRSPL
jgi:beta-mannosidase